MRLIDADKLHFEDIWRSAKDKEGKERRQKVTVVFGRKILNQQAINAVPVRWLHSIASKSNIQERVLINQLIRLWEAEREKGNN